MARVKKQSHHADTAGHRVRRWALIVGTLWTGPVLAQPELPTLPALTQPAAPSAIQPPAVQPVAPPMPDPMPKPMPMSAAVGAPERMIAFEIRDKPWTSVLEWLSEQTGLPVITTVKPTGSFTFIAPKVGVKPKQYTLPEVMDVLNEALINQKFILIRREASFTIVPADEKIDPQILPRITVDELKSRGKTEIVSIVVQLNTTPADELAPELKRLMGPFGEIAPLTRTNQLIMQDTVGNLRRILGSIKDLDSTTQAEGENFSYVCQYVKAREAERVVKDLLGVSVPAPAVNNQQQQSDRDRFRGGFDPRFMPQPQQPQPATPPGTRKPVTVTSDEASNTLFISGPADRLATAKDILKRLDVPQRGQKPILVGPAELRTYTVPTGNAEAMAKTLSDVYKNSPSVRITPVGTASVMIYGTPEDHFELARFINGGGEGKASKTELIALSTLDATKLAVTLKGMFGDSTSGGPFVEADLARNSLIVKGTDAQVAEVRATVQALGDGGGAVAGPGAMGNGRVRVITLDQGSAVTLADALQKLMPQMRSNPVRVVSPNGTPMPPRPMPPEMAPRPQPQAPQQPPVQPQAQPQPQPQNPFESQSRGDFGKLRNQVALVGFQDGPKADPAMPPAPLPKAPPLKGSEPVTLAAFGNRLIVSSDDPEALALVSELVRLITQTAPGEGDFEIIRLRNASATDAAAVLDEAFNGPKQPANQQGGNRGGLPGGFPGGGGGFGALFGGGRFGQPGAAPVAPPADPKPGRLRVVADPNSNSLLVKASPLDMLTIKRLLDQAIDSGDNDSNAVIRTNIVGPLKYATATEVAQVIKDVYSESTNTTPTPNRGGGGPPGFGFFAAAQGSNNANKKITLTIGVDDRTNSLVIACSPPMFEDIKALIEQLEATSKTATRTVRVVPISGVDPLLVQQAIDAIQGRRTTAARPQTGGNSGNTGGFQGGFPGGGGRQGGGGGGAFPGGGGAFPGGGGAFPGGGGGGRQGGGGGRQGGGGGGNAPRQFIDPQDPSFFDRRVTDDSASTQGNALSQPENDNLQPVSAQLPQPAPQVGSQGVAPVLFDPATAAQPQPMRPGQPAQPQPMPPVPMGQPGVPTLQPSDNLVGPRSAVQAEALEELGVIVISGNNQADVEEVLKIIEFIKKTGAKAQPKLVMVPLVHGDATSITALMNRVLAKIQITAGGNVVSSATPTGQNPQFGQNQVSQSAAGPVLLLPVPRFNAIMVGAPENRVEDVIKEIRKFDQPTTDQAKPRPFPLKKASASKVANQIQQFYSTRYPGETNANNQVRVTYDDSSNTILVQAGPSDMEDIAQIIDRIDTSVSIAVNDLRLIKLRNAIADELALTIIQALTQGVLPPNSGSGIVQTTGAQGGLGGGAQGGLGGGQGGQGGLGGGLGGGQGGLGGGLGGSTTGTNGYRTKTTSLRFFGTKSPGTLETGNLEDVHITPESRSNTLVVSAPTKTMELILKLIDELDVVSAARAEINIFTLKKADAALTAALVQQLFLGGQAGRTGAGAGGGGAQGGLGGAQGAFGGGQGGLGGATQGGSAAVSRPLLSLTGLPSDGAALIDLRLTVDERTNSIIAAGSKNDLEVIEAIISRLEDSTVSTRRNEVFKLRNAASADVANSLQNFLTRSLQVLQTGQLLTGYQQIQREVVIVAEPVTNTLLVSATPQYYGEIARLIDQLDSQPPQVVIQVLIAEVRLNNSEEFGIEVGLQSPVLFSRSVLPSGTVVNNSVANPGFGFNTTGALPSSTLADPSVVGFQGLGNLGVGRASATNALGGFVFSAASDSFNILIRALKVQGRIDILSRPQVQTTDNQTGFIQVGQSFPFVSGANITTLGNVIPIIDYRDTGIVLRVTPRISPEGKVLMRVEPSVSAPTSTQVPLGNNLFATAFNVQQVQTTVLASDGETVAIGGLITKNDSKNENKIPILGDLPGVGALFRYRTQNVQKTELIIILTPHIIRPGCSADAILAEESRKVDMVLSDIQKIHGHGIDVIRSGRTPQPPAPARLPKQSEMGPVIGGGVPAPVGGPILAPSTPIETMPGLILPEGTPLPPPTLLPQPGATPAPTDPQPAPGVQPASFTQPAATPQPGILSPNFMKPNANEPEAPAAPKRRGLFPWKR